MKLRIVVVSAIVSIVLAGCGPSEEEIRAQQQETRRQEWIAQNHDYFDRIILDDEGRPVGLCGVRIGQVWPVDAPLPCRDKGDILLRYNPPKEKCLPGCTDYFLRLSPAHHRVISIYAGGVNPPVEDAEGNNWDRMFVRCTADSWAFMTKSTKGTEYPCEGCSSKDGFTINVPFVGTENALFCFWNHPAKYKQLGLTYGLVFNLVNLGTEDYLAEEKEYYEKILPEEESLAAERQKTLDEIRACKESLSGFDAVSQKIKFIAAKKLISAAECDGYIAEVEAARSQALEIARKKEADKARKEAEAKRLAKQKHDEAVARGKEIVSGNLHVDTKRAQLKLLLDNNQIAQDEYSGFLAQVNELEAKRLNDLRIQQERQVAERKAKEAAALKELRERKAREALEKSKAVATEGPKVVEKTAKQKIDEILSAGKSREETRTALQALREKGEIDLTEYLNAIDRMNGR